MNSKRWVLSALLSCLPLAAGSAVACKKDRASEPAPPQASAEASAKGAEAPAPPPAAAPATGVPPDVVALGAGGKAKVAPSGARAVADTPSYTVYLSSPAKVGKGSQGTVLLEVQPKAGWKLNKEFPTKVTVTEPAGVKVARKEQTVADAISFADKSGKWQIEFQCDSPGGKDFTGVFKFAVCTETSCDPKKEQLAWNVAVE